VPTPPSSRIVNLRVLVRVAWRGGWNFAARGEPDDRREGRLHPVKRDGLDLRGELEISADDVITGAEITAPIPIRLLRIRGRGVRLARGEAGSPLLDLRTRALSVRRRAARARAVSSIEPKMSLR